MIKLTNTGGLVYSLSWHPSEPIVAYTIPNYDDDDNLFIQDINGRNIRSMKLGNSDDFLSPLWSPDGQFMLYERYEDLNEDTFYEKKSWVVNIDTGEQWSISNNVDQYVTQITP